MNMAKLELRHARTCPTPFPDCGARQRFAATAHRHPTDAADEHSHCARQTWATSNHLACRSCCLSVKLPSFVQPLPIHSDHGCWHNTSREKLRDGRDWASTFTVFIVDGPLICTRTHSLRFTLLLFWQKVTHGWTSDRFSQCLRMTRLLPCRQKHGRKGLTKRERKPLGPRSCTRLATKVLLDSALVAQGCPIGEHAMPNSPGRSRSSAERHAEDIRDKLDQVAAATHRVHCAASPLSMTCWAGSRSNVR